VPGSATHYILCQCDKLSHPARDLRAHPPPPPPTHSSNGGVTIGHTTWRGRLSSAYSFAVRLASLRVTRYARSSAQDGARYAATLHTSLRCASLLVRI